MANNLSLNEIRKRAFEFSKEWKGERSESAEKQSYWNEFFEVFGIHRRRVALFEVPVQLCDGRHGKIDLFWKGLLLVEHKSAGLDLTAAYEQATDYFKGIDDTDLPKYVLVSDFARFRLYNLDEKTQIEFPLETLHSHISNFGFLTGYTFRQYEETPDVNVKAARYMAELHEALLDNGYRGAPLAVLLVRLMFCFFADKTAIWQSNLFRDIIERKTRVDGSDVGARLTEIFSVLDTPVSNRQKNLDADLAELEYINGHLFDQRFDPPAFDAKARKTLLKCLSFDWSMVSPAIFGAMFQGVMDEESGKRRTIGAHYTSEKNILKVLGPLLIDDLRTELKKSSTERALKALLSRIAKMAILDPACGCGNFLVIAYRELRQLEIETLEKLERIRNKSGEKFLSTEFIQGIDVDAMYGIEIEEFPCRVAETALYITDHMMNNKAGEKFGDNFARLPLKKAPHILHGNALRLDWATVAPRERLTCILGNPPFIGKSQRQKSQSEDMDLVFGENGDWKKHSELDYVAAWYVKTLRFIKGTTIPVAFVSTNSITQGEQVSILWPRLVQDGVHIHFAHRTFQWNNEAPGQAAVHCVIIGWGLTEPKDALLFDYETPKSEPMVRHVNRINPYLVDLEDIFIYPRRKPLSKDIPTIAFGNMPNDGGNLLLTPEQKSELLKAEPQAARFIRRIYGAKEFLQNIDRWCLWLVDAKAKELRALPKVMELVKLVKAHREASGRKATKVLAQTPWLFGEIRQPKKPYILIPKTSSETRSYIPMALVQPAIIASDACLFVGSQDLYILGVLQSTQHMAWMRQVCGRLESRYRYSNEIVYNNFPWPIKPTDKQKEAIRAAAKNILDVRAALKGQSLADLYDTDVMPSALLKAHKILDKAVDACYGQRHFDSELARVKFLFELYAELIRGGQLLLTEQKIPKSKRRAKSTQP